MNILNVLKLRLYPDEKDAYCLDDQSRKCGSLYNKLLEVANTTREEYRTKSDNQCAQILFSPYGLRNLVPSFKEEYPFLKSVHSSPLKNTALRLTGAIKNYTDSRNGKRQGKKINWPTFHRWKSHWFSLLYDEPKKGFKVERDILHLSLGKGMDQKRHFLKIKIEDPCMLKGKVVRTLRVIKKYGIFYALFTIERKVPQPKPISRIIAFDPNHKNLLYGVDNEGKALEVQAPHWLKIYDKRIDELKSKLDCCQKKSRHVEIKVGNRTVTYWEESGRYKKIKMTLNKTLAKQREHTKLFCYRLANQLCKYYDFIAIGNYAPHGQGINTAMRRAMNNRSLIGRCKEIVSWVALKSGKKYYEFDEKGTTRTCHSCSFIVEDGIHPSVREWCCPGCATTHIRDENAACNGLQLAYKELSREYSLPVPSSGPVKERWAWKILSSGFLVKRGDKIAEIFCTSKKLNRGRGSSIPIAIQ